MKCINDAVFKPKGISCMIIEKIFESFLIFVVSGQSKDKEKDKCKASVVRLCIKANTMQNLNNLNDTTKFNQLNCNETIRASNVQMALSVVNNCLTP